MRTVEEHLAHVVGLGSRLEAEPCPIGEGDGRGLAEDLSARVPVPPFDNSAMDGFAVRAADLAPGVVLRVVGDIPAGAATLPTVGVGESARIMTGAPMPEGADTVVPVELTDQPPGAAPLPDAVRIVEPVTPGRHVRRRGEDLPAGAVALPKGLRWSPAAASAAASIGYSEVPLIRRPRVAVLATGSELVEAGQELGTGQIPDSNSLLLGGLVRQFGAHVLSAGRVGDDPEEFAHALAAAGRADLVLTTGGVSVGAFEVVRQVTQGDLDFVKVSMQPGKPQACGLLHTDDGRQVPMIGLPGNPVSVFVSAWVFVRPLIAVLGGVDAADDIVETVAAQGWSGPPDRCQYIPVAFTPEGVVPLHRLGSGSHLVASLASAEGLAIVPAGVAEVRPGDRVRCLRV
ncbi:gephyrin-like molybdotransferase Glp [Arachnia propionica]|uniref:Molybdopterin molybdenumtransferase n=1 Tax=Arachnia propionica TaxID=1750 RepID=A0A3P1X0Y1_9ACTN|nr:gephyrin-like molybdotransferase Glp [Arachnia propionica]RRD51350.1 molybdopterin molybdenumtransferase MoeA [Arachnia propionica]